MNELNDVNSMMTVINNWHRDTLDILCTLRDEEGIMEAHHAYDKAIELIRPLPVVTIHVIDEGVMQRNADILLNHA